MVDFLQNLARSAGSRLESVSVQCHIQINNKGKWKEDMDALRAGESAVFRQRRPRFFNEGRTWYFRTREGASIGPFNRLSAAISKAEEYVNFVRAAPTLEEVVNSRSVA